MVVSRDQHIPRDMRKTHRRFVQWRDSHTGRLPIPEPLWLRRPNWRDSTGLPPPRRF